MAIIATEGKKFKPAPAGLQPSVCVDIVDLGEEPNSFKAGALQHKIRVVWQIDTVDPETAKPFIVSRKYTISLSEKATLRKDLESWRGREFSRDELQGFDLEKLIGVCCQLMIVHAEKDGTTYGNVQTIVPLSKGMERILPRDYVRVKDRAPEQQQEGFAPTNDEDVPF